MVSLSFPDGSVRDYEDGITGLALARSISNSLAKKAVAVVLNGDLKDLSEPIESDAEIRIVRRDDPEALELIRHDAAHVMAEAVQDLYPGTQVTIGPVIENGFYYDFDREDALHPEDDFEKPSRSADARNHRGATLPVTHRGLVARARRKRLLPPDQGRTLQGRARSRASPDDEPLRMYWHGHWQDLCRGPHLPASTGQVPSDAFKLHVGGRRLLAR